MGFYNINLISVKKYKIPKVCSDNEDEWNNFFELKEKEYSKLEIEIKEWSSNINFNYIEYEIDSIWYNGPYNSLEECIINLTNGHWAWGFQVTKLA